MPLNDEHEHGSRGMNLVAPTPESDLFIEAIVLHPDHPYPDDRAQSIADFDHGRPVPADGHRGLAARGAKYFGTANFEAVPTFERASHDFTAGQVQVGSYNGGTSIVVGRQAGRKNVTIWVPTSYINAAGVTISNPLGVVIGQTEGEIQIPGNGVQLNSGDSITIATEAPIWAGLLYGQTSGFCQYLVEYNPSGGELGGF